jgi:hypothetical protein
VFWEQRLALLAVQLVVLGDRRVAQHLNIALKLLDEPPEQIVRTILADCIPRSAI